MKAFKMKEEHLKLIRKMYVGYDEYTEFGAPEIDPKRPYGNSDVYQDMIEILGFKEIKSGIFEFKFDGKKYLLKGDDRYNIDVDNTTLCNELHKLHMETATALQIILSTGKFKPGLYISDDYSNKWTLKK